LLLRIPFAICVTTLCKYRDDPLYDDWVYIAQSEAYYLVHPDYKVSLFSLLQEHLTLEPGTFPRVLVKNPHRIYHSHLFLWLEELGCDAIRAQAHGLKTPLYLHQEERADPDYYRVTSLFKVYQVWCTN
jgi:hypothetical protein